MRYLSIDLEATGLNEHDYIIEFGMVPFCTENLKIEENFDFKAVDSLKKEAIEKLNRIKPENLGQASRIQGISPSDIWNIMVYFEKQKKLKKEKRESECSG